MRKKNGITFDAGTKTSLVDHWVEIQEVMEKKKSKPTERLAKFVSHLCPIDTLRLMAASPDTDSQESVGLIWWSNII